MVGLLTLVSVGTGLVFFGVASALADAGRLGTYREPVVPFLVTGSVALLVFVVAERIEVRGV
jgi:hypothetical protein